MASTTEPFPRTTSVSRPRPGISNVQSPSSPYTPILNRQGSSFYGSPGGFRSTDEEYIVLELGARFLRAGFHGESAPRCTLTFGPSESRRVGDYRQWMPDYSTKPRKTRRSKGWANEHELWRMDLRELDLALVEDKLERALRDVYNRFFLLDKPRRISLVLPPVLPRQLLSAVLNVIFNHFQPPTVSLLTSPLLCTVAAGLRSGLVVDIGWAETTVTAVYEYREVQQKRSIRAGKKLSYEMGKLLDEEIVKARAKTGNTNATNQELPTTFDEADDVLCRLGWCKSRDEVRNETSESTDQDRQEDDTDPLVTIPRRTTMPPMSLEIPFSRLAEPAEIALFGKGFGTRDIDSHNQPLHLLVYDALLTLAVVTRDICMSRIVVTGGVSNLPGVKRRLIQELEALVEERDWDRVKTYGTATEQKEQILRQRSNHHSTKSFSLSSSHAKDRNSRASSGPVKETQKQLGHTTQLTPASDKPHATLAREAERLSLAERDGQITGVIRCAESLGAWAGASLLANLRIKGVVEVEKDRFLQHGLAGSTTAQEKGSGNQRQNLGAGSRQSLGDTRASWHLGVWA